MLLSVGLVRGNFVALRFWSPALICLNYSVLVPLVKSIFRHITIVGVKVKGHFLSPQS